MARPSKYSQKLAEQICERLADGESLRTICSGNGMPKRSTVFRWLTENQAFRDQYAHAREAQADAYAEDTVDISDEECTMVRASKHGTADDDGEGNTEVVFDPTAVARNRLRVDARKWYAGKLAPKKYGNNQTVEHRGRVSLESLVAGHEDGSEQE
ncbi:MULTISPECIES: terminase small subunit protein [unclassified Stenotrophomonas]|uniref:terminase small subunit-like protein n=1 Tax=unclassified Stenotrophomonas TaxID=196198 RepID=UPI002448164C|nr:MULTISPECIES: terminase small subunit protein [unclassified Stenotrophomonas]MDH0276415.1 terminase small subunit protein [Stenotrophomonas sp. GD04089]MDH1911551.1 terminase small subunit protein [Stenotrophomonas sp. GD03794]